MKTLFTIASVGDTHLMIDSGWSNLRRHYSTIFRNPTWEWHYGGWSSSHMCWDDKRYWFDSTRL